MTRATTDTGAARSPWLHLPALAAALATAAVVLLALGPIGWRAGWWHFRVAFQTLMPWAAYCGIAALGLAALALLGGRSRIKRRGAAVAVAAFIVGVVIAYIPWHYDRMRHSVPPIHDITTDPGNPPNFAAVAPARTAEGGNPVAYEGAKVAEQQRRAYPDIAPLNLKLPPEAAFNRALKAAQRMGWTIVAAEDEGGRIEASDRSRWFGFTDDIVVRITPSDSGSRVDVRSSSRLGRTDFGVNAARVRAYLAELRRTAGGE